MPKISVIVPVYNAERFVEDCLRSILAQTVSDLEVIAVDDGSTDSSGAICDRIAAEDGRVKVVHQKNGGGCVARNTGLSNATGEWITFVDADDQVEPNLCEEAMAHTDMDVVIMSYYKIDQRGEKKLSHTMPSLTTGDISDQKDWFLLKAISHRYKGTDSGSYLSSAMSWAKFIRRDLVKEKDIHFPPGVIRAGDTVFWIYAIQAAEKIYYLDKPVYIYRKWEGAITSGNSYIPNSIVEFGKLLTIYHDFIEKYHPDERFEEAYMHRVITVLSWHIAHNFGNEQNHDSAFKRSRGLKELLKLEPYKTAVQKVDVSVWPKGFRFMLFCMRRHLCLLYIVVHSLNRKRSKSNKAD